ncbi:hypothetical protein OG225_07585 [Nocardia sp. NBC_01377]|uniref:hypothetical protein n=1 Tax=Nocardia sp. NBC_01377 TaxID=2903595 RepID=UPI00324513F2
MAEPTRAETQITMVLDAIQSKRRIERVLEAANALLARYHTDTDHHDRLTSCFELIRRNITPDIEIVYEATTLGEIGIAGTSEDTPLFRSELTGAAGAVGTMTARYTTPSPLGLTAEEWHAAMGVLAGILGLGLGGSAGCPR